MHPTPMRFLMRLPIGLAYCSSSAPCARGSKLPGQRRTRLGLEAGGDLVDVPKIRRHSHRHAEWRHDHEIVTHREAVAFPRDTDGAEYPLRVPVLEVTIGGHHCLPQPHLRHIAHPIQPARVSGGPDLELATL